MVYIYVDNVFEQTAVNLYCLFKFCDTVLCSSFQNIESAGDEAGYRVTWRKLKVACRAAVAPVREGQVGRAVMPPGRIGVSRRVAFCELTHTGNAK